MDKEFLANMLDRMDKLADKQTELLVHQAEIASEQKHTAETIDAIKQDISDVRAVQAVHSEDIRAVRERVTRITPPGEWIKSFAIEHPIISVILFLMGVNIILGSLGLPLIDIKATWSLLVNGA